MTTSLSLDKIKQIIDKAAPKAVIKAEAAGGDDDCLFIDKRQIKKVCAALKNDKELAFDMLIDETCLDMIAHPDWEIENDEERFLIVYILYSINNNRYLKLKTKTSEADCSIDSVASVWRAADWLEREIAEMFGVKFTGHPNPKPLFLWDGFQGYPLRKDYPLKGQQPIVKLTRPIQIRDEPGHMTPQFEKDYFLPLPTREINATDRLPTSMLRPTWKEELKAKRLAAKRKDEAEAEKG